MRCRLYREGEICNSEDAQPAPDKRRDADETEGRVHEGERTEEGDEDGGGEGDACDDATPGSGKMVGG